MLPWKFSVCHKIAFWHPMAQNCSMWRILVHIFAPVGAEISPVGAKWLNVARVCEPQFVTLSHIEPQKMWGQVKPFSPALRHNETLRATWLYIP